MRSSTLHALQYEPILKACLPHSDSLSIFTYRVDIIALDFLGHGDSPRPNQPELYTADEVRIHFLSRHRSAETQCWMCRYVVRGTYVCTYVHVRTCARSTSALTHLQLYIHFLPFTLHFSYVHVCAYMYVHTYMRAYVHACVRTCTCVHVRAYVRTYVRTYVAFCNAPAQVVSNVFIACK